MPQLLDETGNLLWDDIACTVPAYRGLIPEMSGPSKLFYDLYNTWMSDLPGIDEIFN